MSAAPEPKNRKCEDVIILTNPVLEFVRFYSISQNNGDAFTVWLQWTGNEERLNDIEDRFIRKRKSKFESNLDTKSKFESDPDFDVDIDVKFSTKVRLSEALVDALVEYGTDQDKGVEHHKVLGELIFPKDETGSYDWKAISNELYLTNVENLFHVKK